VNKTFKKERLSQLSKNKFEEIIYSFDSSLLDRITCILDYRTPLFQGLFLHSFNEFEIKILIEPLDLFNYKNISNFNKDEIESIFIQFVAVNGFLSDNELDFIDLKRFAIVKESGTYIVKFHIRIDDNKIPLETNINKLNYIADIFNKSKYFYDLNLDNIKIKYNELKKKYQKENIFYIYRYKDFSSNFLNLYKLENIKNNANTIINIKTGDNAVNKIIKSSLYSNLYSDNLIIFNIDKNVGNIINYIIKNIPDAFIKKSKDKYEFMDIINLFENIVAQASVKSIVFFLDRNIDNEEKVFFKYLLRMTNLRKIVLISFRINIDMQFDLELNENPRNYFVIGDSTSTKNRTPDNSTVIKSPIHKKLITKLKENKIDEVLAILLDTLIKRHGITFKKLLVDILYDNIDKIVDNEDIMEVFLNFLIREERLILADTILKSIKTKKINFAFARLKEIQICRIRRDYKKMRELLGRLPKKNPKQYQSELNYLKFYYADKYESNKNAKFFYNKIKDEYYLNMADLQICDRLISLSEFEEAFIKLSIIKKYFKKHGCKYGALETDSVLAKYYRKIGDKSKSEYIYKSTYFNAEINNYTLLSGSLLLDIGNLFYALDDFNQAAFWYNKSLHMYGKIKNENGIAICEFNLSEIYVMKGEWNKAQACMEKALINDKKAEREESIAIDSYNLAHMELLKNNIEKAIEYVEMSTRSFEKKGIPSGIIETRLLNLIIQFHTVTKKALDDFERQYLSKFNENQKSVLSLLRDAVNNSKTDIVINKLKKITSIRLKFEMIVFFIRVSKNYKFYNLLKEVTVLLSNRDKNYFYYEYHYIYFDYYCQIDELIDEKKMLFLDVYYFFLKNGRIVSDNVMKLKQKLDEKGKFNNLINNAKTVDEYQKWKTVSDFYNSFLFEAQNLFCADLVFLNIYSDKKLLFNFTNKKEYNELIDEIIENSIKTLSFMHLSINDIRKLKNSGKISYNYSLTKIIKWKISNDFFAILVFGLNKNDLKHIDIYSENGGFFDKYRYLFLDFYANKILNCEKMSFIIGNSEKIEEVKYKIIKLSKKKFHILITGESGTGKELIAKAIHNLSDRLDKPFVPVNIAAIPESLIEAELFGTRRGAFTGANEDRVGLIESADKGTLFLDEIGEIPVNLQAKLLRTLDSGEIRRLGENRLRKVDIRILSATNKNLPNMIKNGEFREDLFYRIANLEIKSPSLRERMSDIPLLVRYFLIKYKFDIKDENEILNIINYLMKFSYKGNIRELQSKIKEVITYYPDYDDDCKDNGERKINGGLFDLRDNYEKSIIVRTLKANDNNKQLTARDLNISRVYLSKLIKKHGIRG